jgi:hypothetical protein
MATTTNFGWETPDDTDLVKDGALAIRTLGSAIDTSMVDLKGGTTGQNLRKNSNTDMDFVWAGDATNTVVDAAGDLLYGTAADTLGRLAIGTAGQVLKVNSGGTAPEWGAASSTPTFVGCKVTRGSAQTIANSTWTTINWDSEVFDTDGFHDNATNNSRLTIPTGKGGKYLINLQARFDTNATGIRALIINKNGTNEYQLMIVPATSGDRSLIAVSTVLNLVAGDYVYAQCLQSSGGNLNIDYTESTVSFGCSFLGA